MKQFEYLSLTFATPSELIKFGKKGWELVSMVPSGIESGYLTTVVAVLKREIEKK